ncbi:leucine-rich single-pass membrane protein 2 isoform 2-T2 [Chlamydotis macqueenii]
MRRRLEKKKNPFSLPQCRHSFFPGQCWSHACFSKAPWLPWGTCPPGPRAPPAQHTPLKWHTSTVPMGQAKPCRRLELALPCPLAPSWPRGSPSQPHGAWATRVMGGTFLPPSQGQIPAPLTRLWDCGHRAPTNRSDDSTGARVAQPALTCPQPQGCAKGTLALAAHLGTAPGWRQSRGHLREGFGPHRGAGAAGRTHAHPLPPLPADSMGRVEGAAPTEPGDADGSEPGAISLRPVESISDLHWASAGQKGAEVLQSQSVRALAQWLESQEDAMHQLRAASNQLWAHLNASTEPGGHR